MNMKFYQSGDPDKNISTLLESFNQYTRQIQTSPLDSMARARYPQNNIMYYPSKSYVPPPATKLPPQVNKSIIDLKLEKMTLLIINHQNISQSINEPYDLTLRLAFQQRVLTVYALEKSNPKDQKEEYEIGQMNPSAANPNAGKLKAEIRIEEPEEIELIDQSLIVTTKQPIKQSKGSDQGKKLPININQEFFKEGKTMQITLKFHKEWFHKFQTAQKGKQALEQLLRSWPNQKLKIQPDPHGPVAPPQIQPEQSQEKKKQELKIDVKPPGEEEEEANIQFSEKDLQTFFPLVTQDFVQKQRELLEKKNSSKEEKIKRLFDEVRIKQFKSTQYNMDKKTYKCPQHKCQKQFQKPQQLRNHIKKCHPKLAEIDLTIDENGEFQFNEKALDYCLLLWKVYPNFIKSVINEMRQRKEQQPA